jgi:ferredoxin
LILADHGSCRGIESLTAVVNDLLRRIAPRGPEGEKMRRRILRLEQEMRSLVFQKQTGSLSALWSMAAANLSAQPGLSAEEKQSLRDDLEAARSAIDVEGEVVGCDAGSADRVMRHLWRRVHGARAGLGGAQLRELSIRLNDLLRSDDLESEESRQPEALRGAFGGHFDGVIDFQAMSRTLGGDRPHARMPAKRRQRIEWALGVLREEKFFGASDGRYEFAFASCTEALAEFKRRLPGVVDLIKAIRIAALELENHYRDEKHDPIFSRFDARSLTAEDLRWFPSYLVSFQERDCTASDRAELIEILSSDSPIKLIFQVDRLFEPDTLSTDPWRTQLAGMAMNLGSAFVVQAATSNLSAMAGRLADGLAAPGPALFCFFAPGEDFALPPYLVSAAAIESRLFPALVFDPEKGDTLAECCSLDGNPQIERDWPVHPFTYEDGQMQAFTEDLAFTAADFLALESSDAGAFRCAPQVEPGEEMVPLAEYLQAGGKNRGRVPFVLVVGPDDRLQRVALTSSAVDLAQRIARRWRRLQGLGNNSQTRRALDEARQTGESEKQPIEAPPAHAAPPAAQQAITSRAGGDVEAGVPVSRDEASIDSTQCISCNECVNLNSRMFTYNENMQAAIADLSAGTYRELVEAAESCKVAIIAPGKPWNPDEPGLEELLLRAEPFR